MTSSLQWHQAWKKILGTFSILVTFLAICKQVWAIFFKKLVIAKLGYKNCIPELNGKHWKKFKIFKTICSEPFDFFLNLFFRKLVIFSKLQLPSLWNRAWAISNFLPNLVVFDFAWRFSAKCEWIFPKSKFWLI